jgi:hypothetical protein
MTLAIFPGHFKQLLSAITKLANHHPQGKVLSVLTLFGICDKILKRMIFSKKSLSLQRNS